MTQLTRGSEGVSNRYAVNRCGQPGDVFEGWSDLDDPFDGGNLLR